MIIDKQEHEDESEKQKGPESESADKAYNEIANRVTVSAQLPFIEVPVNERAVTVNACNDRPA